MYLISVIIPNYNHAKYLNQRIDSVLNQNYQNFELIILDDRSTDDSRQVIEDYRNHPKVSTIIFNEQNSGSTFKQWEKGISLAKGEYIWIAESDDYANALFLETLINIIELNENVTLAYCASNLVNENGVNIGKLERKIKFKNSSYYINNGKDECRDEFFFHPIVPNASAVLFKKDCYFKVNSSYKEYNTCGDWQFWCDIAYAGYVAYTPQLFNNFRQSSTSVSRSTHYKPDIVKIFLLEKLRIAKYIKVDMKISIGFFSTFNFCYHYTYQIIYNILKKSIQLTKKDTKLITSTLYFINKLSVLSFFFSCFGIIINILAITLRKLKYINKLI